METQEAYALSLRLLNIRFLSEGELRKKLKRKEVAPEIADAVMERLKEERFIDDDRLAREVYRFYVRKNQYGHLYICNRLRRRSLPVPDDIKRPDEQKVAAALIARRFPEEPRDVRKIARFLQYRGFSLHTISEILADVD